MKQKIISYLQTLGISISESDILIILKNPIDLHGHARRGKVTKFILEYVSKQFAAMLCMPNVLVEEVGNKTMGITSYEKLMWYVDHVGPSLPENFMPLFTLYLSEELTVVDIKRAWQSGRLASIKYYPKGGTTNSENGILGFEKVRRQLDCMMEYGVPFCIHGETPTADGINPIPGKRREPLFYETEGVNLMKFYDGPVVCEHITTKTATDFVKTYGNVKATITPHHLVFDEMAKEHKAHTYEDWYRYAIQLGMFPSLQCMPVLKEPENVNALWDALLWQAQTKASKFMLGTDTAYHGSKAKYTEGCACGVFNTPIALEMYYMVYRRLEQFLPGITADFQRFASDIGVEFYRIKERVPFKVVAIINHPNPVPKSFRVEGDDFVEDDFVASPFAGETLPWKAVDVTPAYM